MDTTGNLLSLLEPGGVYRRSDLARAVKGVDRELIKLVNAKRPEKVGRGLYHFPRHSRFGSLPPDPEKLVKAFLRDNHFLVISPNDFNCLGVGTTQLYNCLWVYNRKRSGSFEIGGQVFVLFRKRHFPDKASVEFLLVTLIDNLNNLAENREDVRSKALARLQEERLAQVETASREPLGNVPKSN
ncbi:hypothetical protein GMLC_13780 [Geomonas limicola]|uniref:Uncharacterized protein n=1 Tax=Geomonas limicola TaxID=2740186 RepID=A0A6V8N957_9BACT|nr:hypothetical protein [Geomonas limicola]GFO67799.1 hypothetical protein GMLC_13780 [Geomonas limicola]